MDRFGAKRTFGIFLVASACAVFFYSFATGAVAILVGGAVVGFFSNGMFAGYGALISSFYPVQIRSTALYCISFIVMLTLKSSGKELQTA